MALAFIESCYLRESRWGLLTALAHLTVYLIKWQNVYVFNHQDVSGPISPQEEETVP